MALNVGSRLGHYDVTALIGEGGMGQVYRATDTQLGRDVALKILPDAFAADPDRLARFQREAQVLASLNHPNIAQIYGIEKSDDTQALVLELVEGPTLADRIASGPIPLDEALPIAKQIAEALEAAHEAGVIHRDLKPANIKVREDGTVKVLDFGLAKALDTTPDGDPSQSPTLTAAATQMGVIMGTAAYMSPEQARGGAVDRSSDVWSFGVVLYEMLLGRSLFEAGSMTDTLAAVLREEPDWAALPRETPTAVRRLLKRCLEPDKTRRLRHVGVAKLEIDEPPEETTVPATPSKTRRSAIVTLVAVLFAAGVGATLALTLGAPRADPQVVTRFSVISASGEPIAANAPLALSRDGRRLAYGVGLDNLVTGSDLYLHSFDGFAPRLLEGAHNATMPFFAPDENSVGFFGLGSGFRQVELSGGAATSLVDMREPHGVSWGEDALLVFSRNWAQPLSVLRLGEDADPQPFTTLDGDAGEFGHSWPQILPGGRGVLFTVWSGDPSWDEAKFAVADLETGLHQVIYQGGADARYTTSGHLVFWRAGALMAAPFDIDTFAVGEAVNVIEGIRLRLENGSANFAISDNGTLAYVPGGADALAESFVVDRSGRELLRIDATEAVGDPEFSPDGERVAVTLLTGGKWDVGVYDLERGVLDRTTFQGENMRPTWTPDGGRLSFVSNLEGTYTYYAMARDGSGTPERLVPPGQRVDFHAPAWSPDGVHLVYTAAGEGTGWDLWVASPGDERDPRPLLDTQADETFCMFSPDGRFFVYESAPTAGTEPDIVVRPFPDVDVGQWRVGSGRRPVWSEDGGEILYITADGISLVTVETDAETTAVSLSRPSPLLEMPGIGSFDLSPNGERLAIHRLPVDSAPREIRIVQHWFTELERLVPTN